MKMILSRLFLTAIAASALFALSSCTPSNKNSGTNTGFYGPSTENTSNYTDQLRSEFRNNW
ncbi:MAG: hypothetical protein P1U58_08290 [Verrucomicrobiales bacterium]|nr:hypothetical protein [Verrucomicrobiales bacterium]